MIVELKDIFIIIGILGSGITVYVALVVRITRLEEKIKFQTERLKEIELVTQGHTDKNEEMLAMINKVDKSLGQIQTMLEIFLETAKPKSKLKV